MQRPNVIFLQENFGIDIGLFENRAECSLGHVACMIRNRGVAVGGRVLTDLVTSCGLAVELKSTLLYPLDDIAITKASETPHLAAAHDQRVIEGIACLLERHGTLPFGLGIE